MESMQGSSTGDRWRSADNTQVATARRATRTRARFRSGRWQAKKTNGSELFVGDTIAEVEGRVEQWERIGGPNGKKRGPGPSWPTISPCPVSPGADLWFWPFVRAGLAHDA